MKSSKLKAILLLNAKAVHDSQTAMKAKPHMQSV